MDCDDLLRMLSRCRAMASTKYRLCLNAFLLPIGAPRAIVVQPPAVTQDSLVARPATGVAGFQTTTSGLRRVIWRACSDHRFSRGSSARVPALLVILICRRRT